MGTLGSHGGVVVVNGMEWDGEVAVDVVSAAILFIYSSGGKEREGGSGRWQCFCFLISLPVPLYLCVLVQGEGSLTEKG